MTAAGTALGTQTVTAVRTGLSGASPGLMAVALTAGIAMVTGLRSVITATTPSAVAAATNCGNQAVQGMARGILAGMGAATSAARTVVTSVTAVFNSINLHGAGVNAAAGFAAGLSSGAGAIMAVASSIAASVRSTIQSALQIHSPSRVMMEMGQFTGQGLAVGMENMVATVRRAASGLADGITAPISYTAERAPLEDVQSGFTAPPAVPGNVPISASGASKSQQLRKEIKLVIERIILNDTGDKDKRQLVKELLEQLIDELAGADEIISNADWGELL